MKAKTIRETTLELLFNAEKEGRITGAERRLVCSVQDERDCYASNASMRVRVGFMEREAIADEVMTRLFSK